MEMGFRCSPSLLLPPFKLRHLTYATSCRTNGLQSKPARTAITAFFGTTFAAPRDPTRTGFRASEPAIIHAGPQSTAPGPHYVPLNGATRQTGPTCPPHSPVLVRYTLMEQSG